MNLYFPQYRMNLTVGEHSVRHIRRIVRSLLGEWELAHLTDTLELAVSELVTNVVRHVPDRRCSLVVLRQAAGVRVEVTDGWLQLPCVPDQSAPEANGGRGLLLLDALVGKWGVEPAPGAARRCGSSAWWPDQSTSAAYSRNPGTESAPRITVLGIAVDGGRFTGG
ncbi:ATP-binding protein [Streptomyces sp. Ag109_G2-15]|uniref:ATP-binding protein n=1 Tax=Streptomyces sp. Ag109_G2-15 TaxID=1938850 RepID=UPI0027B97EE6|nr:ATP-binding protein [Streptomyces sp. Ag109_G2-15]